MTLTPPVEGNIEDTSEVKRVTLQPRHNHERGTNYKLKLEGVGGFLLMDRDELTQLQTLIKDALEGNTSDQQHQ